MKTFTVVMDLDRSTKNFHVYKDNTPDTVLEYPFYIKKTAFSEGEEPSQKIKVTVEAVTSNGKKAKS